MNHLKTVFHLLGLSFAAGLLPAWAAGSPDAGAIQNQLEQTLRPPAPTAVQADKPAKAESSATNEVRVSVSAFDFAGNSLMATDVLANAVSAYLNRPVSLADLRQATEVIQQLYKEAGWMAQVMLPAQEIDNGRVRIEVVEARLGKVHWSGVASHVEPSVLEGVVNNHLLAGAPIRQPALERALLLLNDLQGVSTTASFARGEQAGQTDLVVEVSDKPRVTGSTSFDNMGSDTTGQQRLTGQLNISSPAGLGDLLAVSALKTEGSRYGRLAYDMPAGSDGLRLGVHASDMAYHTLGANSGLKGVATTYGLDWSYPLIRSQMQSLALQGSWDQKSYRNEAGVITNSDYGIRVGQIGIALSTNDTLAGGGANQLALMLSAGQVGAPAVEASAQGQFTKWLLTMSRVQSLSPELSATLTGQIQRANKNLDSSEKLYMGGPYGVRAYPGTEGSASQGETLVLELHRKLDAALSVSGFYDYGHGRNPDASPPDSFTIKGYGASVKWQPVSQMQLKATAARRIGDASSANSANRLWLSASYSF